VHYHVGLLAHLAEDLGAREDGTNGIAVGPRVRRQDKPLTTLDLIEDLLEYILHGPGPSDLLRVRIGIDYLLLFFTRSSKLSILVSNC